MIELLHFCLGVEAFSVNPNLIWHDSSFNQLHSTSGLLSKYLVIYNYHIVKEIILYMVNKVSVDMMRELKS